MPRIEKRADPSNWRLRLAVASLFLLPFLPAAAAQDATSERIVVDADRLPTTEASAPFAITVLTADDLARAPQLRLDDILRAQVPGFSLFRRNGSRAANPTTQGVTLRNFGPSGAGRTLVLLDGIPLNDPFAGYVLWSQVPPGALESVLVIPGGGAGLFGNAALAGTIFLASHPIDATSVTFSGLLGNEDTFDSFVAGSLVHGPVAAAVYAERFSTSGYPVIAAGQRGPVDNTASSDSDLFALRGAWQLARDSSLIISARRFDDDRGNGTGLTHNDTLGLDASAVWTTKFPAQSAELQVSAYSQHRKFRSIFSAINPTRDLETPALDQFNVPADAAGGSGVWTWAAGGGHRLTFGSDLRWVEGETDENFLWDGSDFTRQRRAGGAQLFAGLFAEDAWSPNHRLTILGGVRYDYWQLFDGFRRETERATGVALTDLHYPDRTGHELNARLGASYRAADALTLRGAGYTGFRVPTLNELYRPFRVGNDVTEANRELQPEHSLGGELGFDWQIGPPLRFSATGFLNRLEGAVGNITIGQTAGGSLRQRQNIDLVLAPGVEGQVAWQVGASLALKASYLFTQPTIEQAADSALEGRQLAQTPEHVFTGEINWTPSAKWNLLAQIHYADRQFDDDQNAVRWRLSPPSMRE